MKDGGSLRRLVSVISGSQDSCRFWRKKDDARGNHDNIAALHSRSISMSVQQSVLRNRWPMQYRFKNTRAMTLVACVACIHLVHGHFIYLHGLTAGMHSLKLLGYTYYIRM